MLSPSVEMIIGFLPALIALSNIVSTLSTGFV